MTTAVLTDHARMRCVEMSVATKRVKRVVRNPDVDYCSTQMDHSRRVCFRHDDTIAVVYQPGFDGEPPLVITVLWHMQEEYVREGKAKSA